MNEPRSRLDQGLGASLPIEFMHGDDEGENGTSRTAD